MYKYIWLFVSNPSLSRVLIAHEKSLSCLVCSMWTGNSNGSLSIRHTVWHILCNCPFSQWPAVSPDPGWAQWPSHCGEAAGSPDRTPLALHADSSLFSIPHRLLCSKARNQEYLPVLWAQVARQRQLQGRRGTLAGCIHVGASALCMGFLLADSTPCRSEPTTTLILPFCHFLLPFCLLFLQTVNSSAKTELQIPVVKHGCWIRVQQLLKYIGKGCGEEHNDSLCDRPGSGKQSTFLSVFFHFSNNIIIFVFIFLDWWGERSQKNFSSSFSFCLLQRKETFTRLPPSFSSITEWIGGSVQFSKNTFKRPAEEYDQHLCVLAHRIVLPHSLMYWEQIRELNLLCNSFLLLQVFLKTSITSSYGSSPCE